jgi:hypothetical protein
MTPIPFVPIKWTRYCVTNPLRGLREWTPRRISAAARAVKRDHQSVALFPELVKYQSVEDRIKEMDSRAGAFHRRFRKNEADTWRQARAQLRQLNPIARHGLLLYWAQWGGPSCPTYLLGKLRQIHRGESA